MKAGHNFVITLAGTLVLGSVASATTENFDSMRKGPLPSDWEVVAPGGYDAGRRIAGYYETDLYGERAKELIFPPSAVVEVVRDGDARSGRNVLKTYTQATDAWIVKPGVNIADGYVEVQAKSLPDVPQHKFHHSTHPHALGLVWRYQDAKNFYTAYLSGANLKFFKVIDGEISKIQDSPHFKANEIKAKPGDWLKVRVEFTGTTVHFFLNDKEYFSDADAAIFEGGGVGIYASGDTSTLYDNFKYGAFVSSKRENWESYEVGLPPPAPWVHGNVADANRTDYPLGTENFSIFRIHHPKSNVLRQNALGVHQYCVKSDVRLRDGYVEVKAEAIYGVFERAMGIIWRWQDENNYYVARANPLEENYTLFKVVDGHRTSINRARKLDIPSHEYQLLRAEFSGDQITVMLNGDVVFTATDDTFTGPGAIGVWTKTDSDIVFEDLCWGGK